MQTDYIPPELALDKYHPHNQPFFQSKRRYERLLVTQQAKCRSRHINIAKAHFAGLTNADIAERHQVHPATVSNILRRPEIKTLIEYLAHYNAHINGPTVQHRKRLILEVMLDNKHEDPKVFLQANELLNKMEGVYQQEQSKEINIHINQTMFPTNKLDKA